MNEQKTLSKETALALISAMRRIRTVEETIAARYNEQKMRCPTHLSSGQEAVPAGLSLHLRHTDLAVSGHRAHAHYMAKGGSIPAMIAEIYGKETGCAHGKGGSMHLVDESVGFMGSTAIVGGTVPVGVGLGYALKMKGTDDLACIFIGDAVIETGAFYESANFAALKKLPVLFICENNFFSVYSPIDVRQPQGREIYNLVAGLGIKTIYGDGNDVVDVYSKTQEAIALIRSGNGPVFLEFKTYRWREHCGVNYDDDLGYRDPAQIAHYRELEPIGRFEAQAKKDFGITDTDIEKIQSELDNAVKEAFDFAEKSPFPSENQAWTDLYAQGRA